MKDETTGKTVEINTDDFNGKENGTADEVSADFEDSFKNVTFNPEESLAFKDDEESADDDEDKEKKDDEKQNTEDEGTKDEKSEETENGESNDEEGSEEEHNEEESEEGNGSEDKKSEDEKPKKKFKFKAKKKTDESLKQGDGSKLNEAQVAGIPVAEPNVLDYVQCSDGNKGQIICKQADGDFIVNVNGHTKVYPKSDVKLVHVRFDTVEPPFKFDDKTLKGIYESYVGCGLFINNTQVTPNDCKVQLNEWMNAKDDDEIKIIVEGERTTALKKYIMVTESLEDVMDPCNYSKATLTYIVEGVEEKYDVFVNTRDYQNYMMLKESTIPVRTLVPDESGETHMKNIPGGNLMIVESEEYQKPESDKLMESALNALS